MLSTVALFGLYGEPLDGLDPTDLARAARTVARAGDADKARSLVELAVQRGGGAVAMRARGDLAKARGDKARALADYEELVRAAPDDGVRLELAKLYEHHVRSPERALVTTLAGTAEHDDAHARRVARLRAKIERQAQRLQAKGIQAKGLQEKGLREKSPATKEAREAAAGSPAPSRRARSSPEG